MDGNTIEISRNEVETDRNRLKLVEISRQGKTDGNLLKLVVADLTKRDLYGI